VKNPDKKESGWLTDPTEAAIKELDSQDPNTETVTYFSNAVAATPLPEEYHEEMYNAVLGKRYDEARELAEEIEEKIPSGEGKIDQNRVADLQGEFLAESISQEEANIEYGGGR
jgi:anti-sigma28 factor (negative regulator of flagellin synthesis)